jgi:aspartate/glutamate racemase
LAKEYWGDTEVMNLLDDKIVADLRSDASAASVPGRLIALAQVAAAAGADAVMLTCSSISGLAAATAQAAGIPVLRVDEAMADEAARIGSGGRIAVIATLSTTLVPTVALIRERLELADGSAEFEEVLVEGAFEAVVSGDRASHDALVQEAIRAAAARVDVVVLAQASMLSAAEGVDVAVPVLSSPELGARRAAEVLSLG